MTEICGAVLSLCRCHRDPHGMDTPHLCGEPSVYNENGCGGSWFGDESDLDSVEIVEFPFAG